MRLFKLSGWMRIWIVLSVLFFLSMSWYGLGQRADNLQRIYDVYYNSCEISRLSNPAPSYENCSKFAWEKRQETDIGSSIVWIGFTSVLPLILIWIFGFISHKIFKWIKKGFVEKTQITE